ncbi:MAG: relaxase/mobilization nuclease domain-containing protein [Eubacterium sp.]|nr:relaxase/mobilization nuclease domain-containing protein [Eubacterium sp.]
MAVTKLWAIKSRNDGRKSSVKKAVAAVTEYAENPEKTESRAEKRLDTNKTDPDFSLFMENEVSMDVTIDSVLSYVERDNATHEKKYVSTINCTEEHSIEEMVLTKEHFHERGNRILWHGYQSFMPGEVTPDDAHRIGVRMAEELWEDRFQVVVTTHLDKDHIHNHIVINSVSFMDGKKFNWDKEFPRMQALSDYICKEKGLSVIKKDEQSGHYHRGAVRAKAEGRYTLEEITREDIDCCILCSSSYDEFVQMMTDKGYRMNCEGKYVRVYPPGHDKAIRIDRRWGESYTIDGIKERIGRTSFGYGSQIDAGEDHSYMTDIDGREIICYGRNFTSDRTTDEYLRIISKDVNEGLDFMKMAIPYHVLKYILHGYNIHIPGKYIGKTISGFMVGFAMYHITAGFFRQTPKQVARTHFLMREDLTKLDRYIAETKFLIESDITTEADLEMVTAGRKLVLKKLRTERVRLRNRMKKAEPEEKEALRSMIKELNKTIEAERRVVFYCDDIKSRMEHIEKKTNMIIKAYNQTYHIQKETNISNRDNYYSM